MGFFHTHKTRTKGSQVAGSGHVFSFDFFDFTEVAKLH
jgi:hypothetical protein